MNEHGYSDTVAAVATAAGPAGVAVVRISGPRALAVADRVVRCTGTPPSQRPAGTFFHAQFADPRSGDVVDDGLVLVFRAPRSYTGEDAVELQGHGGGIAPRQVLQAAFHAGAAPAGPGEFTKRAFLSGRIDLTQAEAVLDLIQAQTERAAHAAREQAAGGLGRRTEALYGRLTAICADIEAMLDFEEGELPERFLEERRSALTAVAADMEALMATWNEGRLLRGGLLTVIAGRVNAGKSSLLNALLGCQRAIVSAVPGTTRDTIEEGYSLDGIPLRLTDTAGMRETPGEVEQEGIARARKALEAADVVLYVIDGSVPPEAVDRGTLTTLPAQRTILVVNKSDRPGYLGVARMAEALQAPAALVAVSCCARDEGGVDGVVRALAAKIAAAAGPQHDGVAVGQRHLAELRHAQASLRDGAALLRDSESLVLAAAPLRLAAEALGRITGRVYSFDLLDTVFSRFCVGK